MEPVITVLASVLFLKESMRLPAIVGAVLIIGAAVSSELIPVKGVEEKELRGYET